LITNHEALDAFFINKSMYDVRTAVGTTTTTVPSYLVARYGRPSTQPGPRDSGTKTAAAAATCGARLPRETPNRTQLALGYDEVAPKCLACAGGRPTLRQLPPSCWSCRRLPSVGDGGTAAHMATQYV
jgi:hypothetical protein